MRIQPHTGDSSAMSGDLFFEQGICFVKYRKISPRIWNDAKFYSASLSTQHLFFFILTHPHMTPVGAMRVTPSGLEDELDWEQKGFPEAFPEAFAEGCAKAFWKYDAKAKFLRVPKFLTYNRPESPNVLKSWVGCWNDLPECTLKNELFHDLKDLSEACGKAFREAFREAFPKDLPESGAGAGAVKTYWVDARVNDAWTAFKAMRRQIKKPTNETAERRLIAKHKRLVAEGHDPIEIIEQSTAKCWLGFFPIDGDKSSGFKASAGRTDSPADRAARAAAEREAARSGDGSVVATYG